VPDKSAFTPQNIAVSVLGGVTAAVIGAVVLRGGLGGILFAHLAPLPLVIVSLGFGVIHGATAAILATIILSIFPHPVVGMGYALLVALPAWLATYVAAGAPRNGRDLIKNHLSSWSSLSAAALLATAVILWLIVATLSFGSLDEALNPIRARAFLLLDAMAREKELPEAANPTELSGVIARAIPAFLAGYATLIHVANLWLGGSIARASGLLSRPWPDIARDFALPRAAPGVFAAGLLASFFSGPVGAIGLVLVSTFGILLMLQGLAVVHIYVRGSKSSALVLSILYFMLGFLGWPIAPLAVLGAADTFFNYRDRKSAAAPGQPQKSAESD
jgi:hypothetical protein